MQQCCLYAGQGSASELYSELSMVLDMTKGNIIQ